MFINRWWYIVVGVLMLCLGVVLFVLHSPSKFESSSKTQSAGGIGGAFELLDGEGRIVTEAVFDNRPRAIMFGFTHCPDICPTGLARMRTWLNMLEEDKQQMRFAFVTVDPERDTPEVLARYVGHFSDEILPLSGTPMQIEVMLKKYGVYAQKIELDGGGYTVDHHSATFLFNGSGQFVEFIYTDDEQKTAMDKLQRLIDS